MPKYRISGITFASGDAINEDFEALSKKRALGECLRIYGKLKRGYQIVEIIENYDIPDYEPEKKIKFDNEIDQEILALYQRIKANVVTQKEFNRFCELVGLIVRRAVRDLWRDLNHIATEKDMEQEVIEDIINEFIPRYDPDKGPLLRFLKLNVRNRIKKRWSREIYVNAENSERKRPRKEALKSLEFMEYLKTRQMIDTLDVEKELEKTKQLVSDLVGKDEKVPRIVKKTLFILVAKAGLHKEILKRKRQIKVFDQYYGKNPMNEREIAQQEGLTQQTIHTTKRRAEDNILREIF